MSLQEKIYQSSPVFLQNMLISGFGYQWKKRRFGGVFPTKYKEAKERESFTKSQWENYQNEQLQRLLLHTYENVPYYQTNWKNHGFNIDHLRHLTTNTLNKLPVLPKDDLRRYGTSTLLSSTKEPGGKFFSSSGSTGTPVKILYSPEMHQRWFGIFEARIRNWAGVGSEVPRGMIGGRRILPEAEAKPPYYRYNYFEKQVYFSAYHINAGNAHDYLLGMQKYGVQYMTGYAMSNYFLARFFKENNLKAPELKAVLPSSEKLSAEMRQMFKEVYNCKTFDSWGSVEACGIVSECEHGRLHISPDAGIVEILDENLDPVQPGKTGDVYCTGLLNYDQPLIRYKIGDRMVASEEACPCGREMQVIKEIAGRIEDVLIGRDGREMVRFHSVFYGLDKIIKSQVIQEDLDHVHVKVEVESSLDKEEKSTIEQRITSQLGDLRVTIEETSFIPLTANGKFQAVVSKVKRKPAATLQG